jgi:hypothetical protein
MVAEKNSVCLVSGSVLAIRSMSGMKPMSSIRSASSTTKISMWVSISLPRSMWSSRRPGVAIRTSAPRSMILFCSSNDTPPISSAMFRLVVLAEQLKGFMHLCGQLAGRLENERARHARAGAALSSSVSMGSVKAAVLPDPVWARPA